MRDFASITILNVDDHEAGRYAVTRQLRREGFRVLEAGTGAEALASLDQQPDLVVLDVNLPDIGGFEICQRIKSNPKTASTLVLHLSASAVEVADRVAGLESGADGYLVQPVEATELVATIQALLRLREARERAARLQGVTAALSDAVSPNQVLDSVMAGAGPFLGIQAAVLALLNQSEQELALVGAIGSVAGHTEDIRHLPLAGASPLTEPAQTHQPLFLDGGPDFLARYPHLREQQSKLGDQASAWLPLTVVGRTLGTIGFSFADRRTLDKDDREFVLTLARLCAQAVDRAQLYELRQRQTVELEARVAARTSDLSEANRLLEQSQAELRSLSAHLQAVREDERTRIAREIHDVLGQQLTGIRMDAVMIKKRLRADQEDLMAKTEAMLGAINGTIGVVRRIATELRPAILDDFGLAAAIEWEVQQFEQRAGIECEWSVEVPAVELPKDVATAVFRVLQEVLTNVARHADATRVEVVLEQRENDLSLQVHDNGRGIDESALANSRSLGLLGMRERVSEFAGQLQIWGEPGKGTTVLLRIPLTRPAASGASS